MSLTTPVSPIGSPGQPLDIVGPDVVAEMLGDLDHPGWGHAMPEWLTSLRVHQIVAITRVVNAFRESNVVILDAPVGSGKSLIAELVRRILSVRSVYVCTTKTLQHQLNDDFVNSHLLKGRANYPTQDAPFPDVTAGDCTAEPPLDTNCMWCPSLNDCAYNVAKRRALGSEFAILNTAYFLTEANGPGAFGVENPRGLVVLDECDELEGALMGQVEVVVGEWWRDRLGIGMPEVKTETAQSNDWQEWAEDALERMEEYCRRLPRDTSVKSIRHRKKAYNLKRKLSLLVEQLPEGGWVYDGYQRRNPTVIFRPVKVDQFGQHMVFRHGERFLLMSGSVISADAMAADLGLQRGQYRSVVVDVDWDKARRPVYVSPVASVTYKTKDESYPLVAKAVREIIEHHPGERILVHGVSYQLCAAIFTEAKKVKGRLVLTYTNAGEREGALDRYKATEDAVIIAPSLDRGVDFKDDLARVQVVAKVPYPNLGDKQVSQRTHMGKAGQVWFSIQTIRTVIQMIGRGMRHEDDSCVTYVLDGQMDKVRRQNRALIPKWVQDVMVLNQTEPWKERP